MQFTEGRMGRVFVLRLEDGERLNDTLEAFARQQGMAHGLAFYLGGSAAGSQVVVGPEAGRLDAIVPLIHKLSGSQEVMPPGTRCCTCTPPPAGKAGPRWAAPGPGWTSGWWAKWSCWKSWGLRPAVKRIPGPALSC
jgi:hypothetical protein